MSARKLALAGVPKRSASIAGGDDTDPGKNDTLIDRDLRRSLEKAAARSHDREPGLDRTHARLQPSTGLR